MMKLILNSLVSVNYEEGSLHNEMVERKKVRY